MVGQPERQREGRSGAFNKSWSEVLRMFLTPVSSITSWKLVGQPERDGEGDLETSVIPAAGNQDVPNSFLIHHLMETGWSAREGWRGRSGAFSNSCSCCQSISLVWIIHPVTFPKHTISTWGPIGNHTEQVYVCAA
ncbi:uncharacterized protein [Chiloscyllium punctatum]|uniref:uncharacterized protein isoform X2 n=1 Tax=Chiloscyllium punctatum TaxID=137246 RepID=UPI003B63A8A3